MSSVKRSPKKRSRELAGGNLSFCSWLHFGLTFETLITFLEGWGRKKMSCELRCFKNKNGCSNLQMINKQGNMEKEWESEGKGQTQEQVTVRLNTSEKLSDHQTCCMCHMCLPEGNGKSALFYSETPLQQTTENTTGVQSSECKGERGCGRVSSAWQNMCFSLS